MDKAQAVQEVIKLKKQYETTAKQNPGFQSTPEAKALSQQASALRQQYQIDDSKYGSGATLADAYTNYYKEFGGGGQQQAQQQQAPQPQGPDMSEVSGFYQQASTDFFNAQKSNLQSQLQSQLTQLEQAYAQAISEGKISVRDAEQQFEAQKAQIEKAAYQQAEATKGYGSEMGISNSQQMIGLQQNDNARVNSMNNANASDRDKRVNDIRDRINAVKQQKDLAIANVDNQYQIGLQGAQAQASQMYNQSVGGLMEKNYFSDKEYAQQVALEQQAQSNRVDMAYLNQHFNLEMLDAEQVKKLEAMAYDAELKAEQATVDFMRTLEQMEFGHKLDIDAMVKKAGLDRSNAAYASALRKSENAQMIQAEIDQYRLDQARYARSLGISNAQIEGTSNLEGLIADVERRRGLQAMGEKEAKAFEIEMSNKIKTIMIESEIEKAFGEEIIVGKDPRGGSKRFSEVSGMWYDVGASQSEIDAYDARVNASNAQAEAQKRLLSKYGVTLD